MKLGLKSRLALVLAVSAIVFASASGEAYAAKKAKAADESLPSISEFCLDGCPLNAPEDDKIVTHHIYTLANNPHTKYADWVAYKITADSVGSGCKRNWKRDPSLSEDETLVPNDYKGARKALGVDRGHQAPLASLCGAEAWAEANYLSNITPQQSDLNEGPWKNLEEAERTLLRDKTAGEIYSVTGPLYERTMPKLPKAHVDQTTPSGYWKVVSYMKDDAPHMAAFIMDQHTERGADFCNAVVTLDELEERTHLIFFPGMQSDRSLLDMRHQDTLNDMGCSAEEESEYP